MPASSVEYRPIPSSPEDQADHPSGAREVDPTNELSIRAETLSRWTYLFLGCATLLPWNALINASSFFLSRLVDSPFYRIFNPYLSTVYTLTLLACQFYSTVTSKQSSPSRRIFASLNVQIVILWALCLCTSIRGTPLGFFSFALFSGFVSAVTVAYLSTAVFATAPLLGISFLQTLMSGQAAVAVAVSTVQVASTVISLWTSSPKSATAAATNVEDDDVAGDMAARIFFGVSAIFLSITLAAYTWLSRQSFYKSITSVLEQPKIGHVEELTPLVADQPDSEDSSRKSKLHIYRVFKQNFILLFSLALTFAVTLSVYPATTVRVRPVNPDIHPLLFTAVHFLAFNGGDLIGRYTCALPYLVVWSAERILVMSLLRILFIPLVLLCNVYRSTTIPSVSPIINSDTLYMIILLAMGYSNGYVSTRVMLVVASLEHNPRLKGRREDVDIASTLAIFFVVVGLASGALASFAVEAMI